MFAQYAERESAIISKPHPYQRDESIPQWHGWHAARRGLGSNLYRLGVPDKVIQRILRHAHVSTTLSYFVKSKPQDALDAMAKLEKAIPENSVSDTQRTPTGKFSQGARFDSIARK